MREIKFRFWDIEFKKMFKDHEMVKKSITINEFFCSEYSPVKIMQFTGLQDISGKDIYEGDIVEMKNWEPKKYQIVFKEGAFCLANNKNEFRGDIHYIHHANTPQAEIVGNIFENQDFLEQGRGGNL